MIKLRDLVRIVRGASPRPKGDPKYFGGSIPWVSIRDITSEKGRTLRSTREFVTEEGAARSRLLPAGTLVLTNSGTVCVPKFLGVAGCIHDGFVAFLDVPDTVSLSYLFDYFDWLRPTVVNKFRQGVTQVNLNTTIVGDFDVPLPTLDEQERITAAIDSHFSRLDAATATLERVHRNLERYRASVLKAAVEGRLVPTEAELAKKEGRSYEPASVLLKRILAERRRRWEEAELAKLNAKGKAPTDDRWKARYEEPVAPDTYGLPELPEGWCWASVDQVTAGDRMCAYGVLVPGPDVVDGVPLVRVGDIDQGRVSVTGLKRITRTIADRFGKTYLRGGEVLLTLVGTIGRAAVVPRALAGANVARAVGVIPPSDYVDAAWLCAWFRSPWMHARMVGKSHEVARKTLNLEDVRVAAVALPPQVEQARVVERVSDVDSLAESAQHTADAGSKRISRLRQSILKWAFDGRLLSNADPERPC